jgi:RecA-family ATPase
MSIKLAGELKKQKKSTAQVQLEIVGTLGISLGGQKLVEVPNRKSFVYVKLRDNQNELIQAFNNKVAPSYGLPVIVQRQGNRYVVLNVDTLRYQSN